MDSEVIAAWIKGICAIIAAVVTGGLAYIATRQKQKLQDDAIRKLDTSVKTKKEARTVKPESESLVQDLAADMPIAVTRPSELALGSIMCSVGGVMLGIGLLIMFTTFARSSLFVSIIFTIYCLGIGVYLIRSGYRNHLVHIAIGRENGDIIQKINRRLSDEDGYLEHCHTDEKIRAHRKKWERS